MDTPLASLGASEPGAVHVIVGATHSRILLSGEIDADIVADLHQATQDVQEAGLPVEIDAHHVTFMDSTGVAFLARLTAISDRPVRMLRTPPTVRFLLEVTSIGELLQIDDDADSEPTDPAATFDADLEPARTGAPSTPEIG
ncbi:STAS domain-containing protein [Sanguibacter antarcticus]|uniref:STAS domain-containing protein n=1 Tax=Sanguibacter antarcticus TaxID=372484 RepID=UPI001FEB9288|nr:STAS domain-containing protein [Sanguibacter antarcticus]